MNTLAALEHSSFAGWIGVAQAEITPPLGIYARSWGAARHETATGLHRPLFLTVLTFRTGAADKPFVLLAADLGWWKNREDEFQLRSHLLLELGLDAANLMFCLSHTHAGPSLCREDRLRSGGEFIEPYLQHLQATALSACQRALRSERAATLSWASGSCDLASNRDLPEPGTGRFICGFNPEVAADRTVLVGRVSDHAGKLMALIVNYACHPTTLAWENKLLSPDYIGATRALIESRLDVPLVFLQGASGDLAPAEQYTSDTSIADAHGRKLGFAVLAVLEGMLPPQTALKFSGVVESGAPLAMWKLAPQPASTVLRAKLVEMDLPLKKIPSCDEIEQCWRECDDGPMKERLWRQRSIRKRVGDGETVRMPLWVWRLGDSYLVGQPNEAYSCFQMGLRSRLASRAVAVINIVNGYVGYLPPRELYAHNIYAVWQTPFAEGAAELLMDSALRALQELDS